MATKNGMLPPPLLLPPLLLRSPALAMVAVEVLGWLIGQVCRLWLLPMLLLLLLGLALAVRAPVELLLLLLLLVCSRRQLPS